MELDSLKNAWQKDAHTYSSSFKKDRTSLEAMLAGKAVEFLAATRKRYEKIIGGLIVGMLLMVLVMPVLSDGFTYPGSVFGFTKLMFFYGLLLMFYWLKFKSIHRLELSDQLKQRLNQLLKMTKQNFKIEVWFIAIFYVSLLVMGRFFYGKGLDRLDDKGFLISFPLSLIFAGLILWLISRRYRTKIKELETYLKEFDVELLS